MSGQVITPLFLGASFLIIAVPGPDTALLISIVLRTRGRLPAFAAATGMITAGAGHALLALSGAALVLRTHPALLTALRWGGALIMLGWGLRALLGALRAHRSRARRGAGAVDGEPAGVSAHPAHLTARRAFAQGAACTGSNPKVALFLLAYLPQFVPPTVSPAAAMVQLSRVYLAIVALWLSALVLSLAALRDRAAARSFRRAVRHEVIDVVLGAVLIGFAVRLARG